MNKITVTVILLLCFYSIYGQSSFSLEGEIKPSRSPVLIYHDLDTTLCQNLFSTAEVKMQRRHVIFDDTACPRSGENRNYMIMFEGQICFIPVTDFLHTDEIDKALKELKTQNPDRSQRSAKAQELFRKQQIADSLEEIRQQKIMDDSLAKIEKDYFKLLDQYAAKNIVMTEWSWEYENEYSFSPTVSISVINPYKKKIKYISFTLVAYNAVGDPAVGRSAASSTKTMQGIGPIASGDMGSYKFDYVFNSKVVSSIKMSSIKIQFYDNTYKVISSPRSAFK